MFKSLSFFMGAAALAPCTAQGLEAPARPAAEGPERPNILLFLVDDMGWMDSSLYGSKFYQTPHMEALAASGMVFTDAYAACTVSSPTRAALMTGKYPARLHLTDFIAGHDYAWARLSPPDWTPYLPLEEVTVAEALHQAGYATWHIGKWHLGQKEMYFPQFQGFDVNIAGCDMGSPGSPTPPFKGYFPPYKVRYHLEPGAEGEYLTDRLTEEAVALIRKRDKRKPFYLNMAHYAVHMPIQAKEEMVRKYQALVDSHYTQTNPTYAAMIESMDQSLGVLMQTLEEEGILENTLLIFTSDNGAHQKVSGNQPLRSGKGSEYEGGLRVPLIAAWPGHIRPQTASHTPVISMDIAATLMDLAGRAQDSVRNTAIDGRSLLPLFAGKKTAPRPLFWHYPHYHTAKPYSAVRLGPWKLIEHLEDGSLELYNLRKDLSESQDLAQSLPAKTRELYALLKAWRTEVGAQLPTPNPRHDPAKAQQIQKKPAPAQDLGNNHLSLLDSLPPYATRLGNIDKARTPHEVYRHKPDLKLYFLYPEGQPEGQPEKTALPAIVFFFGGGWTGGDIQAFAMQAQELAQKGMVAVLAEYRIQSVHRTDPPACVQDAKSALRYLRQHAARLGIDPDRLVAAGGSAGGHLAAATALVKGFDAPEDDLSISPVPSALVLFNPVVHNGPAPEGYGYERIRQVFPAFSPYHNVAQGNPPTLFLVGTRDKHIPVTIAQSFAQKLREVGTYCDLELYDGAPHGFFHYKRPQTGPQYYRATLNRTLEFLQKLGYIE